MALRLLKLQVPCHLILMKDFVHGFHSLIGIDEGARAQRLTIEHFNELFEQVKQLKENTSVLPETSVQ